MKRKCTKCGVLGTLGQDFSKDSKGRGGYRTRCNLCDSNARAARKAKKSLDAKMEQAASEKPLEAVYRERRERLERALNNSKIKALAEENERLLRERDELVKMQAPLSILVYKKPIGERSDAVACAIASDWHVEEEVKASSVHGLNEYNLEVAEERARRFFQNLLTLTNICARDSKINSIHMGWLGDNFSGYIHDELAAANLLGPGDAAHFSMRLYCSGIDFLLKESKYTLEVDALPGNHGRITDQVWHSNPTGTSLETFMYHAIAARYEGNPRVRIRVADKAMIYRRFFESFVLRQIHGYEVKFGGGVGGITIPIRKAIAQWDIAIKATQTNMGHFHQRFDGGNFLVNGSMIGFNTYAQAIKASFERPVQSFYLVHARHGGEKSITAPIWLDDASQKSDVQIA